MKRPARSRSACAAVVSLAAIAACRSPGASPPGAQALAPLSVARLLSGSPGEDGDAGFARAVAPRDFRFPEDDGPHPTFRSEWWYFTGIVRAVGPAPAGRRFGYEMTVFRRALVAARSPPPSPSAPASAWATRDVFMAHFAITDVDGTGPGPRFHAYEQFARDGLGLAGARAHPFAAWVDDWRMEGPPDRPGTLPIHLRARADGGAAIDLVVGGGGGPGTIPAGAAGGGRGPTAQGDRGLSAKGPRPGQASYYYSRTRLPTRGRLTLPDATGAGEDGSFEVGGLSWMDREWATDALGAEVRGWDWLGAHLSDGRDLMLYRLRDQAGQATPESGLTITDADGNARRFTAKQFTVTPIETWTSPRTGAPYPVALRLQALEAGLLLDIRPLRLDQELRLSVNYWEGAVSLAGSDAGGAVGGEGYLELTGYGGGQRQ
ncbi:MAG TPA: lipocalin-like domain-containing protein [Polyangia bacterium]|nr:lipocalin-like domain-containing protein [Polyangia bacterium]